MIVLASLLQFKDVQVYRSQRTGSELMKDLGALPLSDPAGTSRINVDPTKKFQEIIGFGSALTETAAYNYAALKDSEKPKFIEALYGPTGLNYEMGRCHIGSADFALSEYGYIQAGDTTLATWSFDRELQYVYPFLQQALKVKPKLWLLGSPWSPPAHFKDNNRLVGGGKLRTQDRDIYSKYMAQYVTSYLDLGVEFAAVTIQNEPMASQSWESCLWSGQEEGEFAAQFLRPALDSAGLKNVKILFWDHNRGEIIYRSRDTLGIAGAPEALWGMGVHWYGHGPYDNLNTVHDAYPNLHIVSTELCRGDQGGQGDNDDLPHSNWYDMAMYCQEYLNTIDRWTEGIIEWNAAVDEKAGPYHNRNSGVKAPIVVDRDAGTFSTGFIYNAIAHFSRYIKRGAVRLGIEVPSPLQAVACENPDGTVVVVVLNEETQAVTTSVVVSGQATPLEVPGQSVFTLIFE